jgi:hypothetical protein
MPTDVVGRNELAQVLRGQGTTALNKMDKTMGMPVSKVRLASLMEEGGSVATKNKLPTDESGKLMEILQTEIVDKSSRGRLGITHIKDAMGKLSSLADRTGSPALKRAAVEMKTKLQYSVDTLADDLGFPQRATREAMQNAHVLGKAPGGRKTMELGGEDLQLGAVANERAGFGRGTKELQELTNAGRRIPVAPNLSGMSLANLGRYTIGGGADTMAVMNPAIGVPVAALGQILGSPKLAKLALRDPARAKMIVDALRGNAGTFGVMQGDQNAP